MLLTVLNSYKLLIDFGHKSVAINITLVNIYFVLDSE